MKEQVHNIDVQDVPSNGSSINSSIHEHKGEIAGKQELGLQFFASTPQKPEGKPIVELERPEKYEEARELFGSMITSVRLLGLRKTIPTYQKISKQVELLTGRYEEVRKLFGSMITSVRLLGLRKIIPTFQKMSKQVELFTGRYEEVRELFGSMITSVRLLCLRKTILTFQKISERVELLTRR